MFDSRHCLLVLWHKEKSAMTSEGIGGGERTGLTVCGKRPLGAWPAASRYMRWASDSFSCLCGGTSWTCSMVSATNETAGAATGQATAATTGGGGGGEMGLERLFREAELELLDRKNPGIRKCMMDG